MDRSELAAIGAAAALAVPILASASLSSVLLVISGAFLCAAALWIALVDTKWLMIPDGPIVSIGIVGLALRIAAQRDAADLTSTDIAVVALDASLWSGCFLLMREAYFRRRGFDGIGLGDVKLAAACGVLVGSDGFAWALLSACCCALLVIWLSVRVGRRSFADRVAFGAFLAPACCGIWIIQAGGLWPRSDL